MKFKHLLNETRLNSEEDAYIHSVARPQLLKYIEVYNGKETVITGETAVLQNLAIEESLRSLFRHLKRTGERQLYDVALRNKEKELAKGTSRFESTFTVPYMSWYSYDTGVQFVFYGKGQKVSYFYTLDGKVSKTPKGKLKAYAEDLESYAFVDWGMTELKGYAVSALGE